jgi:lysophospholipase L1-like esterase
MIKIKENDVILFQGDSITDGNRGRNSDPNHIHGHGYQYILASEILADNLGKNVTVYNRGISGNRIADLYARWIEDCLNLEPTILSILIGVNEMIFQYDHNCGASPERFKKTYRLLIEEVLERNPETKIVIMEPFFGKHREEAPGKYIKENIVFYQKASKEIAEKFGLIFVPLQEVFDEASKNCDIFELLWDGVHPTTAGHQLIARQWKKCVLGVGC